MGGTKHGGHGVGRRQLAARMRRGRDAGVHNRRDNPRLHREHQRGLGHTRQRILQPRHARHSVLQHRRPVHDECKERVGYHHRQLLGTTSCQYCEHQLYHVKIRGRDGGIAEGVHWYYRLEHDTTSHFEQQLYGRHLLLIGERGGTRGMRQARFGCWRGLYSMWERWYMRDSGSGCGSVGPSIRLLNFYYQQITSFRTRYLASAIYRKSI